MNRFKWLWFLMIPVFSGVTYLYVRHYWETPALPGAQDRKVIFDLTRGMTPQGISETLEKNGIIGNATLFLWAGKVYRTWGGIKSAEYELSPSLSPRQLFKVLQSGIGIQKSLLIREGDNIFQVAEAFASAGMAEKAAIVEKLRSPELIDSLGLAAEAGSSLEGYLLPNTYFFDKRETPEHLIRRMVDAFKKTWSPEYEARSKALGLTRREVVILASVVEKETGAGFERPMIASVFHNRLKKKMRLQSDPTTIYGIWENYSGNLHRSDLLQKTPYNTYAIPALPAGPISNPNPESIRAVLYPAETEFLYFVSKNDGTHIFSKTYAEHAAHVRATQLDPRAREGKSWRDLGKSGSR